MTTTFRSDFVAESMIRDPAYKGDPASDLPMPPHMREFYTATSFVETLSDFVAPPLCSWSESEVAREAEELCGFEFGGCIFSTVTARRVDGEHIPIDEVPRGLPMRPMLRWCGDSKPPEIISQQGHVYRFREERNLPPIVDVMSSLNRQTTLVDFDERVRRLLAGTGERVRRRRLSYH